MKAPPSLLLLPFLAAAARADVLVVDDDDPSADHAQIAAAVQAASDGDAILVRGGVYDPFTVQGKGLAIFADLGHDPVVRSVGQAGAVVTIAGLAADQLVVVRGLRVADSGSAPGGIRVADCLGPVWLEDVSVEIQLFTTATVPALSIADCASVSVVRSAFEAPPHSSQSLFANAGPGLQAARSTVHLVDCQLQGAEGEEANPFGGGLRGGHGAVCEDGTLYAVATSFTGGRGGDGSGEVILTSPGGDGGDGLFCFADAEAFLVSCTLTPGEGGVAPLAGTDGSPGAPSTVLDTSFVLALPAETRGFAASAPSPENGTSLFSYQGEPGETLLALDSPGPAPVPVPLVLGVLFPGPPVAATPGGIVPAGGQLDVQTNVGAVGAGASHLVRIVQPAFLGPAGGVVLGTPSALLVLDDGT